MIKEFSVCPFPKGYSESSTESEPRKIQHASSNILLRVPIARMRNALFHTLPTFPLSSDGRSIQTLGRWLPKRCMKGCMRWVRYLVVGNLLLPVPIPNRQRVLEWLIYTGKKGPNWKRQMAVWEGYLQSTGEKDRQQTPFSKWEIIDKVARLILSQILTWAWNGRLEVKINHSPLCVPAPVVSPVV